MEFLPTYEDCFTETEVLVKSDIFSKCIIKCLHQWLLTSNLEFTVLNTNSESQSSHHFKLQFYNSETIHKNSTHFREPLQNYVDPLKIL